MPDELEIRLRLSDEDVQRGQAETSATARNVAEKTAAIRAQLIDLEKIEHHITRRIARQTLRTAVGIGAGELTEILGLNAVPAGRLASHVIWGAAMGGPTGAIAALGVGAVTEVFTLARDAWQEVKEIRKKLEEQKENLARLREGLEEERRRMETRLEAEIEEVRRDLERETRELVYQTTQYID